MYVAITWEWKQNCVGTIERGGIWKLKVRVLGNYNQYILYTCVKIFLYKMLTYKITTQYLQFTYQSKKSLKKLHLIHPLSSSEENGIAPFKTTNLDSKPSFI